MLWALGQPAAAAGLVGAFLLGVGLRVVAQRLAARGLGIADQAPVRPSPRLDLDPLGVLVAVLGGTGWGRGLDPCVGDRRRQLAVLVAGPLVVLVASQVVLGAYRYAHPEARAALRLNYPSDVLRGVVVEPPSAQLLLSVGVGLLCFALLALVPLPPLDGFGLCWLSLADPGERPRQVRRTLADHHLGAVILLVLLVVPLGARAPLLLQAFDVVGTPLMRIWA